MYLRIERIVGKEIFKHVEEVVVRHARDKVYGYVGGLCGHVRVSPQKIVFAVQLDIEILFVYRRGVILAFDVANEPVEQFFHHWRDGIVVRRADLGQAVELCVVFGFAEGKSFVHVWVERQIRLAHAVRYYVARDVVDYVAVLFADNGVRKICEDPERFGVLPILADIRYHVRKSHDAALESARAQGAYVVAVGVTSFEHGVEHVGRGERGRLVFFVYFLAAVTKYAVESLNGEIVVKNIVQRAHAVHVVVEVFLRGGEIEIAQNAFARMTERRVPYVVPDGNGFDEIEIKPERAPDLAGYARYELYVRRAPCDLVVVIERKNLRFVAAVVVKPTVDNAVGVDREIRA